MPKRRRLQPPKQPLRQQLNTRHRHSKLLRRWLPRSSSNSSSAVLVARLWVEFLLNHWRLFLAHRHCLPARLRQLRRRRRLRPQREAVHRHSQPAQLARISWWPHRHHGCQLGALLLVEPGPLAPAARHKQRHRCLTSSARRSTGQLPTRRRPKRVLVLQRQPPRPMAARRQVRGVMQVSAARLRLVDPSVVPAPVWRTFCRKRRLVAVRRRSSNNKAVRAMAQACWRLRLPPLLPPQVELNA